MHPVVTSLSKSTAHSKITTGTKVNHFYAIVVNFTLPKETKGTDCLMRVNVIDSTNDLKNVSDITQHAMTEITLFSRKSDWRFPRVLSSGDIIRIHRASMNERGCFASMNKSGSAVVVDLETEERKSTSSDYNWTKQDDKDVRTYVPFSDIRETRD
jgi:hypothetical protein